MFRWPRHRAKDPVRTIIHSSVSLTGMSERVDVCMLILYRVNTFHSCWSGEDMYTS